MEYIEILLPIFRIYQLCGFAPFPIPFGAQKGAQQPGSTFWKTYNGLLLVYMCVLVLINIISYESFLEGKTTEMLTYLSYIMICGIRALAAVTVVESTLKNDQHISFLQQLTEIGAIFRDELCTELNYKKVHRDAFIWITIWLIQNSILLTLILVEVFHDYENTWERIKWILFTIPLLFSSIKYYQIIQYIKLIGFYFHIINIKLELAHSVENRLHIGQKVATNNFFKPSNHVVYDEIVSLRRIYHNLWKCTAQLNLAFRWSLLLLTGASFIIIVVNYYRTMLWIMTPDKKVNEEMLTYFVLSVSHTFYFIKLSGVCYYVSQEVCMKNATFKIYWALKEIA